jgi:Transglycosylase SLT domain.
MKALRPFGYGGLVALALACSTVAHASPGRYRDSSRPIAIAATARAADRTIRACIDASAQLYHLPPALFLIILHVEGGRPGFVTGNTNSTVDIGPMQINQIWLPTLARHWHATTRATFRAIRDNFCANVAAGGWILARSIREADGHLWQGVAYYHSRTRRYQSAYLRAVLREVTRLQAQAAPAGAQRGRAP